ncbi:MAG TPA: zf-HC2 domain-containing protein [Candidatus Polarisedimenticolia bacterium]
MNEPVCRNAANALLPWYLNGSLSHDEESRVRAHVETCDVCSSELDELTRSAHSSDPTGSPAPPALSPAPVPLPAPARRLRFAHAISAVLAVPALLGLYWLYLGLPGPHAAAPGLIHQCFVIDLGAGPEHAREEPPLLGLPAGAESVVISFQAPGASGGRRSVELLGPDGRTLARHDQIGASGENGRFTYAIGAESLRRPGLYEILLIESPAPGGRREHRYPFMVENASPPR